MTLDKQIWGKKDGLGHLAGVVRTVLLPAGSTVGKTCQWIGVIWRTESVLLGPLLGPLKTFMEPQKGSNGRIHCRKNLVQLEILKALIFFSFIICDCAHSLHILIISYQYLHLIHSYRWQYRSEEKFKQYRSQGGVLQYRSHGKIGQEKGLKGRNDCFAK